MAPNWGEGYIGPWVSLSCSVLLPQRGSTRQEKKKECDRFHQESEDPPCSCPSLACMCIFSGLSLYLYPSFPPCSPANRLPRSRRIMRLSAAWVREMVLCSPPFPSLSISPPVSRPILISVFLDWAPTVPKSWYCPLSGRISIMCKFVHSFAQGPIGSIASSLSLTRHVASSSGVGERVEGGRGGRGGVRPYASMLYRDIFFVSGSRIASRRCQGLPSHKVDVNHSYTHPPLGRAGRHRLLCIFLFSAVLFSLISFFHFFRGWSLIGFDLIIRMVYG